MDEFLRSILLALLATLALRTPELRAQVRLPAVEPGTAAAAQLTPAAPPANFDPQFERGQPHKVIDSVGWVFGIPRKLILWDRRAVNHSVTPATEQSVAQYLDANGMTSTKVRVNEYDPGGEWHRLVENKS